jgi:uncharacterized protein YciI
VSTWIYFLRATRSDFAPDTMTDVEVDSWRRHFARFRRLLAEGTIVLVGPTLDESAIGVAILEAPDEPTARRLMEEDPTIAEGHARGELHPFRVSLLRGRD